MKNWCLICCIEREIEHPLFFNTKEEAHKAMVEDFARTSRRTVEEAMEIYNTDCYENVNCEVNDSDAWHNYCGNYDWRIFYIAGEV